MMAQMALEASTSRLMSLIDRIADPNYSIGARIEAGQWAFGSSRGEVLSSGGIELVGKIDEEVEDWVEVAEDAPDVEAEFVLVDDLSNSVNIQ